MIVTIDGPAGAGKSSTARRLAERLGFDFLDTGAMYRAVTFAAVRAGVPLEDEPALATLLGSLHLELPAGRVVLNGEDITDAIRQPEITAKSASIANSKVVRERLVEWQRDIARGRDIVTEGRDQGTLVFPQAECKFYLTAEPRERARRRYQELVARGEAIALEDVLEAQEARDRRDAARAIAPMKPADDALVLDSTGLTLDDVVERMLAEVRRRQQGAGR
jgi:cytidylate kinase